jgi:hypothetical protein
MDEHPDKMRWSLSRVVTADAVSLTELDLDEFLINEFGLHTTEVCLELGDYLFTSFDDKGDGLCCACGFGSYSLIVDRAPVAEGGQFGSEETWSFFIPLLGSPSSLPSASALPLASTLPSSLPSLALSYFLPTTSSQPSTSAAPTRTKYFPANGDTTKEAVDKYIDQGCSSNASCAIGAHRGWLINSCRVSGVMNMTQLFSYKHSYTDNILSWDVGQVTNMKTCSIKRGIFVAISYPGMYPG